MDKQQTIKYLYNLTERIKDKRTFSQTSLSIK